MKWYAVLFLSILVEAVVAYVKTIVVDRRIQWQTVFAILLGGAAAVAFKVDLLALAGVTPATTLFGELLSGVLISRGSDYIVEFIGLVGGDTTDIARRI